MGTSIMNTQNEKLNARTQDTTAQDTTTFGNRHSDEAGVFTGQIHEPYAQQGITHHKENAGLAYERTHPTEATTSQQANKDQAWQPAKNLTDGTTQATTTQD